MRFHSRVLYRYLSNRDFWMFWMQIIIGLEYSLPSKVPRSSNRSLVENFVLEAWYILPALVLLYATETIASQPKLRKHNESRHPFLSITYTNGIGLWIKSPVWFFILGCRCRLYVYWLWIFFLGPTALLKKGEVLFFAICTNSMPCCNLKLYSGMPRC